MDEFEIIENKKISELNELEISKLYDESKIGFCSNVECECGKGKLVLRKGKTLFLGCSCYPQCNNTYGSSKKENPQANLFYISRIVESIDLQMRQMNSFDGLSDYDDDIYSWGTGGGIYCSADM